MSATVVAVIGSPNAGKTALFNALTGARQKTGNYPGVTVERKYADIVTGSGHHVRIVDLPGTYGFNPISPDEKIAVDILTGQDSHADRPDLILAVVDSTNLERNLRFVLELKRLGKPIILALNMIDLAEKRGLQLDTEKLSQLLDIPIMTTVAIKKRLAGDILQVIDQRIAAIETDKKAGRQPSSPYGGPQSAQDLLASHQEVKNILQQVIIKPVKTHTWTERIDKIVLHPMLSGIILALILFTMFQAVFSWAEAPMEWIESGVALLGEGVTAILPEGLLQSMIVDGAIAGVGSVLVFLPQILLLFFFIYLLESSGYMMRAAYILNKLMTKIGLPGMAVVPLLSSFACAIPGMMAARTIKGPRDRLLTILVAPLMTCSARVPVYVLLIGAFIPNKDLAHGINLQGLVMSGLFVAAVFFAMLVIIITKLVTGHTKQPSLMMDLPTYKWPDLRNLLLTLWQRAKVFLNRAGKLILVISIIIWALATFPKAPEDWQEPAINYSYAGRIGQTIAPILEPIGFDWRIATGLIPGFAAREVMVGAMGTVFAVEGAEDSDEGMTSLQDKVRSAYSLATGLALLVWYIFSPQCLATFAVMRRETNSWKWPLVGFSYMLLLAYLAAYVCFHVTSYLVSTS